MKIFPSALSMRILSKVAIILSLAFVAPVSPASGLAAQGTAQQAYTPPLSPIEEAEKNGTALRLSLKDISKLALQNNLDIAISDTNEELYQQRVIQAYGPYDPQFIIGLSTDSSKFPNTNLTTASAVGTFNQFSTARWNARFVQNIPTGGGFAVDYNTRRQDTTRTSDLFNPQYGASSTISFTQPLFRNFRIDQTRAN